MSQEDDPLDDLEASLYASARRRTLIARVLMGLVAVAILCALAWWFKRPLRRALFDAQLAMRSGDAPVTADQETMALVHAELIPTWAIYQSRGESARERADSDFAKLEEALTEFPAALALMRDLREDTNSPAELAERNDDIVATITSWNEMMSELGRPWWIDGTVLVHRDDPAQNIFYIKTYRVLGDTRLEVADATYRTRFVARADHTNVVESMLGHASPHQDGAIILADRLYDFATRDLWPLLDPALDPERDPEVAPHAARVREQLLALVSKEDAALLADTAKHRFALEKAIASANDRAVECQSRFRIYDLPWDGLAETSYERFRGWARDDVGETCASLTRDEAEALVSSSEALKDGGLALRDAVGALVAVAAHKVSVHEARHSADHATADAFETPLPCEPCRERMSRSARAELSAYAATFAHEPTSYVALFQACSLDLNRGTPHASALRSLLPELGDDACASPPADLVEKARAAETHFFGRSAPISLPEDFPSKLELYERKE